LGALNASYQERITKDMLLTMLVIMGALTYNNDAKGPLEDQEANTPYWSTQDGEKIDPKYRVLMEKKMRVVSPKLEGNKKLGQQKGSKCHF
jgi:hypothetical protein